MQNQTAESTAKSMQDVPRPEHPRPIFMREPWINLNGPWRFTFDPRDVGEQLRWYRIRPPSLRKDTDMDPGGAARPFGAPRPSTLVDDPFGATIIVPFPWESRASGIQQDEQKGAAWYQRVISVPAEWGENVQRGTSDAETSAGEGTSGSGPAGAEGLPSIEDAGVSPRAGGGTTRWRLRPYLCFGAVDWNAKVWVNGRFVGEHDGGYTPFELDLSEYVQPGQDAALTVRAWDNSAADTPLGKQTINWYTSSSGIWQTVWLEGRPAAHLTRIHVTPHLEEGRATFDVSVQDVAAAGGAYRLTVTSSDGSFPEVSDTIQLDGEATDAVLEVAVPSPRAWSPEDPHLYECTVTLAPAGATTDDRRPTTDDRRPKDASTVHRPPSAVAAGTDAVQTYFGLRTVSKGKWQDKPYEYVFLNGEPVYLRGALDQAFHPDGLHSYPTDDAIRADVQAAKDLGLNYLRSHIKINDPRYYYWCDKLGVLMMYDFPSCRVYTAKARANWEATFRESLERDYSHPCIFSWILFNETWGLEEHQTPASWRWVKEMFDLCKELDQTRLVEDNSACLYDHVDTDINTWHFYISEYDRARRHVQRVVDQTYEGSTYNYVSGLYGYQEGAGGYKQGVQPLLNSEYAGLSARQGDKDVSYTFKFLTTELRRHDKICGYLYTELADIEWEHNGFLNYDRTAKEFGYEHFVDGMTIADLNGADFVGFDCAPCQTLAPGSTFSAPAFVSHWDKRPIERPLLRWRATFIDRFGDRRELEGGERALTLGRYGVTDGGTVEVRLPDEPGLATIALFLADGETIRARNYVNAELTTGAKLPEHERREGTGGAHAAHVVRFEPAEFVDSNWPNPRLGSGGSKFGAAGAGWVEYAVRLPDGVDAAAVKGLRLRFEAGARTARSRVGWHDPLYELGTDYPQTEAYKLPSNVRVTVNGVEAGTVHLPDDPADSRGVLSAHNSTEWEYASYGFLTDLALDGDAARRALAGSRNGEVTVRFEVPRSAVRGGFNLYGVRLGAYPVDPMLFIEL